MSRRSATAAATLAAVVAVAAAVLAIAGDDDDPGGGREPAGRPAAAARLATLRPVAETDPVPHDGDAADDPAIWVHPDDPARSTIVATDKQGGLAVYDLDGRELQYLAGGRPNNVDVRGTLVATSDRSDDTVDLLRIDVRTRRLVAAGSFAAGIDVYGICLYRNRRGEVFVFVDSKSGDVEQWRIASPGGADAAAGATRVRRFDAGGDVEGCVADDAQGRLYVAEEDRGIWRYGAEPQAGERRALVDGTGGAGHLAADVEGLAVAGGHLVASSQGDDRFAVYRRGGANAYVRSFDVGAARGIDAVSGTDGLDVTATALGPRFPRGLLVVQDGDNDGANQNFKLVRWRP